MSIGCRRCAVIGSLLLLFSPGFAAWVQLNSGTTAELYSVHFPEGTQVGYAVGAGQDSVGDLVGVILKTTDRGDTWQVQDAGHVSVLYSVYFKNNDTGYAVGQQGLALRTTDGGMTWFLMTVLGTDDLTRVQLPENGQTGYIFTHPMSPPSSMLKTTDGGTTWAAINVGESSDVTRGGSFANDSVGVIVGDDGLVLGTNGPQDPQTNADLVAVAFSPDPTRAYLIGNDSMQGVIRYTDDGGATPWDSCRCRRVTAFYGVDVATSDAAYICGAGGRILRSVSTTDFYRTTTPDSTTTLFGLCFPAGRDTGFAVGAGGVILRTFDGGIPFQEYSVAEGRGPTMTQSGIRIVSNPSRRGITFRSDSDVRVSVFDAAGRVVVSHVAAKGLNFLPLSNAGVYLLKVTTEGFSTTQKLVVEH